MTDRRPHIVLMSQEVWPLVPGGGIGRYVRDASRALAPHADVTILTGGRWRPAHDRLVAAGEAPAAPGVRFAWAPEPPADVSPFRSWFHASAAAFLEGLRAIARERPIDLVEYDDFRGIGAVVAEAVRAKDPLLRGVRTLVRQDTAWEITQTLDGREVESIGARWIAGLEREALRSSDCLVSASPEAQAAYRRYYGVGGLPEQTTVITRPIPLVPEAPTPPTSSAADGLRLLYVGRLQECKGVRSLIRVIRELDSDRVSLTLVGGDTDTGPGGSSMRRHLHDTAGGDPRIRFRERVGERELEQIFADHHVVVMPSRFESHGYVAREAMAQDRPVLVTPCGGLRDALTPGRGGWIVDDTSDAALRRGIEALLADPQQVDRMIAERLPSADLVERDDEAFPAAYLELATAARAAAEAAPDPVPAAVEAADVTALIWVGRRGARLGDSVRALEAQTTGRPEIIALVDRLDDLRVDDLERLDGAFAPEGGGDIGSAARRALRERAGTGPLVMLTAGVDPEPSFLARVLPLLESTGHAYVTAWGTGRGFGNRPVGNSVAEVIGRAGVATTVTVTTPETGALLIDRGDREGFAELAAMGGFGLVVPEPLAGRIPAPEDRSYEPAALAGAAAATVFVAPLD